MRIGNSIDFHPFKEERDFILGGVKIDYPLGLDGDSDADCLYHSIAESILGALAMGDLGTHFKRSESMGLDSSIIMKKCVSFMKDKGYKVTNVDSMILLQEPKLKDYIFSMRENVAKLLECDIERVSIKATTTDNCGMIGRGEGVMCFTSILLEEL